MILRKASRGLVITNLSASPCSELEGTRGKEEEEEVFFSYFLFRISCRHSSSSSSRGARRTRLRMMTIGHDISMNVL